MVINDLVSVCISAYNHERYIKECIYSLIAQTYQNIELLVIDDGSTDKTFEILQSLEPLCRKRFSHIVFEKSENYGCSTQSNRLLDMAQGNYVYSIASDDVSKPQAIEKLHMFLAQNPDYVLAVGDNEIIDANSKRIYWDKYRNTVPKEKAVYLTFTDSMKIGGKKITEKFGCYETLLCTNHIPNGYLIRKQALIDAGKYRSDIFLEDWYMNLQLVKQGKIKYFPDILFSYRWHGKNTIASSIFHSKQKKIYRQIYTHEKEYCFTHGYKKLWKKLWCNKVGLKHYLRLIRNFLRGKRK